MFSPFPALARASSDAARSAALLVGVVRPDTAKTNRQAKVVRVRKRFISFPCHSNVWGWCISQRKAGATSRPYYPTRSTQVYRKPRVRPLRSLCTTRRRSAARPQPCGIYFNGRVALKINRHGRKGVWMAWGTFFPKQWLFHCLECPSPRNPGREAPLAERAGQFCAIKDAVRRFCQGPRRAGAAT